MPLPTLFHKKPGQLARQLGEKFLLGVAGGLGQALGLTLVFALIVRYFTTLITTLGGVPYLGNIIARIVAATQNALPNIQ